MNYQKLGYQDLFSCKIKNTYVDIYFFTSNGFEKVFSLLKSDYPDIIGYGEQTLPANGLVPITLTDECINFILKKHFGVGLILDNTVIKDANALQMQEQANNQFAVSPETYPSNPVNPAEPNKSGTDLLIYLGTIPNVYVNLNTIDCEVVSDEDVEVEDVEEPIIDDSTVVEEEEEEEMPSDEIVEEIEKKKNINWIWLAAAAALLL